MKTTIHVLIVGGGISGLTLANLLVHGEKKNKVRVTLFESKQTICPLQESIGGGIGLWPPSQSVLKNIPNFHEFIDKFGYKMPNPSYRDYKARILAKAHPDFDGLFPVQSVIRDDLLNLLLAGLEQADNFELITGQTIEGYQRDADKVIISCHNRLYKGDLLIACDGIHSKIRHILMAELKHPPITKTDLGYTYFRANPKLPVTALDMWWSSSFETWGSSKSIQHGNHEIRFGYVPLKPPNVFWFIAIKTQEHHKYLSPIKDIRLIDHETKAFLIDLVRSWEPIRGASGSILDYVKLISLTDKILRTDIAKIQDVETFPWAALDNRVILLGDSAHATAPNIAQGAGLGIEDAACLVSKLDRIDYLQGVSDYVRERKIRAKTVQNIADTIATIGQVQNPLLKQFRNMFMYTAARFFPSLQQRIFNYVVSFSLGGSTRAIYWQAPQLSITDDTQSSFIGGIFIQSSKLDDPIKAFKTSRIGGSGFGVITVKKAKYLTWVLEKCLGFPKDMYQGPFYAEVVPLSKGVQCWKRVFGYKSPDQRTYSTTHSGFCGFNRQVFLSEGIGGFLDKTLRFIYKIQLQPNKTLKYSSEGLTWTDLFKIPFSKHLLKSEWIEKPTQLGWEFDGKISCPLVGSLLHYYGQFKINPPGIIKNKKIIIAGGSGMIGQEVCLECIKKGYEVYCLSRFADTKINLEGIKVRVLYEDWSDIIDSNTIILNLSGASPGSKRWTNSVKSHIANSRFQVIENILINIKNAGEKPLKFLQASAAGFYGDAGEAILTEKSKPIIGRAPGTTYRVETCKEIEKRANKAECNVVHLRIGHVLSNTGGLLPYFKLAAFFLTSRFATGEQFVPFIHINDVARAIEFIADSDTIKEGAVNVTAPNPCTNTALLNKLRFTKRLGIPIPRPLLKFLIGQSFVILTDSERVLPQKLLHHGFKFNYNTIDESIDGLQ
ncbi:MAG: DUF1731 domain-containing protein [Legionella sp.]|nr:DUF1731 domain-containing protein [Legionella sp.]